MKIFVVFILALVCTATHVNGQSGKFDFKKLKIEWRIIENTHHGKNEFLSSFTFYNTTSRVLPAHGWSLYFNMPRTVRSSSVTKGVKIKHLNGDLYRLTPDSGFVSPTPDQPLKISFAASDWAVNFTDSPSGLYFIRDDDDQTGIPVSDYQIVRSTEPAQYLRTPDDKVRFVTPQDIFRENTAIDLLEEQSLVKVFPTPITYAEGNGLFMITENTTIESYPGFSAVGEYLSDELSLIIGKKISANPRSQSDRNKILLTRNRLPEGAYKLSVNPSRIEISAGTSSGIFYGIQSVKMMIAPATWKQVQRYVAVPAVEVEDAPRFGHRAFFLDVARNFQSKNQLMKLLDLMALYKLNVLHFHFSDDEGWRIEIPDLPELIDVGSRRGHTLTNKDFLQPSFGSGPDVTSNAGTGYYSREEFIEVLKYATDRFIRVIPEIETPGHARAAVKSMKARYERLKKEGKEGEGKKYLLQDPEDKSVYRSVQGWNDNVMDVGMPSTYVFLEKVVDELMAMYKEAGAPLTLIHFGGDEVPSGVWERSPACVEVIKNNPRVTNINDLWYYFFGKVNEMVKSKGLTMYGWEEIGMRKTVLDGSGHYIPNPDFVKENFHVDVWNNVLGWGSEDLAYRLANAGYKVVMSCVSNLYFDMAYYKAFDEPGYYWGSYVDVDKPFNFIPYDYFRNSTFDRFGNQLDKSAFIGKQRLTDYGKENIVGIQGLLFSENTPGRDRMEYQMLPKMLGLAERAWAADPAWARETDPEKSALMYTQAWSHFVNVLGRRELPRLDYYHFGFNYRIPSPGLAVRNGEVVANIQFPGLILRYTTDGKDPSVKSSIYDGPIPVKGRIKVRAFSHSGRAGKIAEITNP